MADKDKRQDRQPAEQREPQGDDPQAYEQALKRTTKDLPGDTEQNRNLSGSTTYQTLTDEQADEGRTSE
jgi:hypothetical protein